LRDVLCLGDRRMEFVTARSARSASGSDTSTHSLDAPNWLGWFVVHVASFAPEPPVAQVCLFARITPRRNRRLTDNRWEYP